MADSGSVREPFSTIAEAAEPPYVVIPVPEHVSTSLWQQSYYDPTSRAPLGEYVKLNSGPLDFATGRRNGEDFADSAPFKQV